MLLYSHHVVEANYYTSILTHIFHVGFLVLITMAKVTQHGVGNIQCFCLIQRIVVNYLLAQDMDEVDFSNYP
jgi:hypothetical protein